MVDSFLEMVYNDTDLLKTLYALSVINALIWLDLFLFSVLQQPHGEKYI